MIKWIGIVLLVLIAVPFVGFYAAVFHSTTERELTCEGSWERGGNGQAEIAHMVLTESRFWVWWTDSDGDVMIQTDKSAISTYVPFVRKIGDGSLALYMFSNGMNEDRKMVGGYREANRELTIEFSENFLFVGHCKNRV